MTRKIQLITKLTELKKLYVIYELRDIHTAAIVYVGCAPLIQLMSLPDVWRNPRFDEDKYYILDVTDYCENKIAAKNLHAQRIREKASWPEYNRYSYEHKGMIICEQTGEVFETIADAARVHAIDPGALSNHLNRKPGFKSVKKRTYSYKRGGF